MARRKGGRRIKRKTQKVTDTAESTTDIPPRAFVFSKGAVPGKLKALVENLKRVLSPNTATALRAQKRNKLRDFVDVAGMLHVSFFLIVAAIFFLVVKPTEKLAAFTGDRPDPGPSEVEILGEIRDLLREDRRQDG